MSAPQSPTWVRRALALAIGQRIRAVRKAKGITQRELAMRLGSHRAIVARMENGHHVLTLDNLYWYARALEVPVEEIARPANILQRWL